MVVVVCVGGGAGGGGRGVLVLTLGPGGISERSGDLQGLRTNFLEN